MLAIRSGLQLPGVLGGLQSAHNFKRRMNRPGARCQPIEMIGPTKKGWCQSIEIFIGLARVETR
jgi:hypothetical protein